MPSKRRRRGPRLLAQRVIADHPEVADALKLAFSCYKYTYNNPQSLIAKDERLEGTRLPPNVVSFLFNEYGTVERVNEEVDKLVAVLVDWAKRDLELELLSFFLDPELGVDGVVFFLEVWGRIFSHSVNVIGAKGETRYSFLRELRLPPHTCRQLTSLVFDPEQQASVKPDFWRDKDRSVKSDSSGDVLAVVYLRRALAEYFRLLSLTPGDYQATQPRPVAHSESESSLPDEIESDIVPEVKVEPEVVRPRGVPSHAPSPLRRTEVAELTPSPLTPDTPKSPESPATPIPPSTGPISIVNEIHPDVVKLSMKVDEIQAETSLLMEKVDKAALNKQSIVTQCARASIEAVASLKDEMLAKLTDHLNLSIQSVQQSIVSQNSAVQQLSEQVASLSSRITSVESKFDAQPQHTPTEFEIPTSLQSQIDQILNGQAAFVEQQISVERLTAELSALTSRISLVEEKMETIPTSGFTDDLISISSRVTVLENKEDERTPQQSMSEPQISSSFQKQIDEILSSQAITMDETDQLLATSEDQKLSLERLESQVSAISERLSSYEEQRIEPSVPTVEESFDPKNVIDSALSASIDEMSTLIDSRIASHKRSTDFQISQLQKQVSDIKSSLSEHDSEWQGLLEFSGGLMDQVTTLSEQLDVLTTGVDEHMSVLRDDIAVVDERCENLDHSTSALRAHLDNLESAVTPVVQRDTLRTSRHVLQGLSATEFATKASLYDAASPGTLPATKSDSRVDAALDETITRVVSEANAFDESQLSKYQDVLQRSRKLLSSHLESLAEDVASMEQRRTSPLR